MKMPKQTAPVARNLNTTAQAADQNGVEASFLSAALTLIPAAISAGKAIYNAVK